MARRALFRILTLAFACLLTPSAWAQAVAYDNIDQATVRVLGMGNIETEAIEDEGQTYQLAVPIAGHGSGVLLSKDGLILTAAHVIADTRALAVLVPGHLGPLPAVTVYTDTTRDFALLRVKGDFEHVAELADPKAPLAIRQDVFAIGYPLDATRMDPQSTPGIVSGVRPSGELQLGMSVNPGNSGGPVVDSAGKVRGIVVSRSRLDEGAVGLAYAVPLQTFIETVNKYASTPADVAQRGYLEADASRRLADLTSLMSLYGLDVLKASLSRSELEVDPRIKGALDEASEGAHASTDGRLLSAVFYWNQSLVMRRRGDTNWPTAQAKAVSLVRDAAKAEPALQTKSEFVKLLLSLSPAPPVGAPPSQATASTYGNVDVQPPSDTAPPPTTPSKRRKRTRALLEAGPVYNAISLNWTDRDQSGSGERSLSAQGIGFSAAAGVQIETRSILAFEVGAHLAISKLALECSDCSDADIIEPGSSWDQTIFGVFMALNMKYLSFGGRLNSLSAGDDGEVTDPSGWMLGLFGGPSYTGEHFGAEALVEYNSISSDDLHGSVEYSSWDVKLFARALF